MKREEKIEMIQEIIEKKDPYIGLYAELIRIFNTRIYVRNMIK